MIDVLCAPCLRAGKRRKLARFLPGRADGDGPTVLTEAGQGGPGQQQGARWGVGPPHRAGEDPRDALKGRAPYWTHLGPKGPRVQLRCGCGHAPQIRWEHIVAALNAGVPAIYL